MDVDCESRDPLPVSSIDKEDSQFWPKKRTSKLNGLTDLDYKKNKAFPNC